MFRCDNVVSALEIVEDHLDGCVRHERVVAIDIENSTQDDIYGAFEDLEYNSHNGMWKVDYITFANNNDYSVYFHVKPID